MSKNVTGLFTRGDAYYLRVVLPEDHPARSRYTSGKVVASLGTCDRREAARRAPLRRAQVLAGEALPTPNGASAAGTPSAPVRSAPLHLRDVLCRWTAEKPRSLDTVLACTRAVALYEEQSGTPPIASLTRSQGVDFRAWLQDPTRGTTSKTARDRFTWVKSLLRYACRDLEAIPRNPWEGLDIEARTTHRRRPWRPDEIAHLLAQPLHANYALPRDAKAGGPAAYWLPLLALYSGARIGELAQLRRRDVACIDEVDVLQITDEGEGQQVKTAAGVRTVPVHSELVRLGLLDYVDGLQGPLEGPLWPALPLRKGKPGGFFSQWWGTYRRRIGLEPDLHSCRHTVRSMLADVGVSEPMIDQLLGHQIKGSTGARVYTHRSLAQLKSAIERIAYPSCVAPRVFSTDGGTEHAAVEAVRASVASAQHALTEVAPISEGVQA